MQGWSRTRSRVTRSLVTRSLVTLAALLLAPNTIPAAPKSSTQPTVSKISADPLTVQTDKGPIVGFADKESTYAWLGIPFAAPPTGARRWKAPEPATAWTTARTTQAFASGCPQIDSDEADGVWGSEDCLYLNVWRPQAASSTPRPVMVWIHGGGNTTGSADFGMYYGAHFAAQANVVLVSIQYRLGMLGFVNHPALASGDPAGDSGNFGMLDQIRALEWVRDNAAAFGGDPSKVTVFGESAGGFNTWALIMSERADKLFHRAIVESGCPYFLSKQTAQGFSQQMVEALVVSDGLATAEQASAYITSMGPAWVKQYLYGKTPEQLLPVLDASNLIREDVYYNIEDGYMQRPDALGRLERGDFTGVPTIIGSNRDEMKIFIASYYGMKANEYNQFMTALYGDNVSTIESYYPMSAYGRPFYYNRLSDVLDGFLELQCSPYAAMLSAPHQPTWLYTFRYDNLKKPYDNVLGACHAAEMPFVFGNFSDAIYPSETLAERTTLSNKMIGHWSCLAYTGNPSGCAGVPSWSRFETSGVTAYSRMAFDQTSLMEPLPQSDFDKIELWNTLYGLQLPDTSGISGLTRLEETPLMSPYRTR